MAAPTVVQLIEAALNELGEYEAGEMLAPEDTALALTIFNDFIDALNADNAVVYAITRTTWPLVANTTTYAVGVGAVVNVPQMRSADDIQGIGFINNAMTPPVTELSVGLPLTEQAFMGLPQKGMASPFPQYWYYKPTLPTGTLSPWPVPTSANLLGLMYHSQRLAEYTNLTDLILMPYGYRRWFRKALAIELAPAFGAQASPELTRGAAMAEMIAKRANKKPMDMTIDAAALGSLGMRGGGYSIYTDK